VARPCSVAGVRERPAELARPVAGAPRVLLGHMEEVRACHWNQIRCARLARLHFFADNHRAGAVWMTRALINRSDAVGHYAVAGRSAVAHKRGRLGGRPKEVAFGAASAYFEDAENYTRKGHSFRRATQLVAGGSGPGCMRRARAIEQAIRRECRRRGVPVPRRRAPA